MDETTLGRALDVDTRTDDGRTVVELAGELDVYSTRLLRETLERLPHDARARLVVEVSGLDFLDSSGLGVLVNAMKQARALGGGLCLVGAQERILKIFRITGLNRVMPAFAALAEAFDWLDQTEPPAPLPISPCAHAHLGRPFRAL